MDEKKLEAKPGEIVTDGRSVTIGAPVVRADAAGQNQGTLRQAVGLSDGVTLEGPSPEGAAETKDPSLDWLETKETQTWP